MIEPHEVLSFKEFFKEIDERLGTLYKQYYLGNSSKSDNAEELSRIYSNAHQLKEFIVPIKQYDGTLGYIEFESKKERDRYYHYAMHEKDMNFR